MIIKRDIQVEELEDEKMFLVKVYIEDKLNPEQIIDMQKSRNEIIANVQKDIDAMPAIIAERTNQLNSQLTDANQELDRFKEHEAKARLWKTINEKVAERSSPDNSNQVTTTETTTA